MCGKYNSKLMPVRFLSGWRFNRKRRGIKSICIKSYVSWEVSVDGLKMAITETCRNFKMAISRNSFCISYSFWFFANLRIREGTVKGVYFLSFVIQLRFTSNYHIWHYAFRLKRVCIIIWDAFGKVISLNSDSDAGMKMILEKVRFS